MLRKFVFFVGLKLTNHVACTEWACNASTRVQGDSHGDAVVEFEAGVLASVAGGDAPCSGKWCCRTSSRYLSLWRDIDGGSSDCRPVFVVGVAM